MTSMLIPIVLLATASERPDMEGRIIAKGAAPLLVPTS